MLFCLPNIPGETNVGGQKEGLGGGCDMVPDGMSFVGYKNDSLRLSLLLWPAVPSVHCT